MDIHNLMEVLQSVEDLAIAAKQVLKDGKVDLADLPIALALLPKVAALAAAVDGVSDIPAEVKDMDAAEIQAAVAKLLEVVQKVQAA